MLFKSLIVGVALLVSHAAAQDTDLVGSCGQEVSTTDQCKVKYPGTLCTSVLGATISKCTVTAPLPYTCGGMNPGNCPTRGAWPTDAFPAGTICLFQTNVTCLSAGQNATEGSGLVACQSYSATVNQNTSNIKGIWQCFASENVCSASASQDLPISSPCRNCISNNGTYELCNGRGSCVPDRFDITGGAFRCQCNPGFGGDLCANATDNSCDVFSGCGNHGSCSQAENKCVCNNGWTGNQCAKCTSNEVCQSKNTLATCETSTGTCKCKNTNTTAYSGDDCTVLRDLTTPSPSKSDAGSYLPHLAAVTITIVASLFV